MRALSIPPTPAPEPRAQRPPREPEAQRGEHKQCDIGRREAMPLHHPRMRGGGGCGCKRGRHGQQSEEKSHGDTIAKNRKCGVNNLARSVLATLLHPASGVGTGKSCGEKAEHAGFGHRGRTGRAAISPLRTAMAVRVFRPAAVGRLRRSAMAGRAVGRCVHRQSSGGQQQCRGSNCNTKRCKHHNFPGLSFADLVSTQHAKYRKTLTNRCFYPTSSNAPDEFVKYSDGFDVLRPGCAPLSPPPAAPHARPPPWLRRNERSTLRARRWHALR